MKLNESALYDAVSRMTNEISTIMDGKIHGVWLYGSVVSEMRFLYLSNLLFIVFVMLSEVYPNS